MRKVDLIDQEVRPCNFNDFYYYPKYFTDEKIEAIHVDISLKRVERVVMMNQQINTIVTIEILLTYQVILILGGYIMN